MRYSTRMPCSVRCHFSLPASVSSLVPSLDTMLAEKWGRAAPMPGWKASQWNYAPVAVGLSPTIIGLFGSHLQMKNTLEKAKAEMDAASKAAQADARAKSKTPAKTAPPNREVTQNAPAAKPAETGKAAPQKPASLFDMPDWNREEAIFSLASGRPPDIVRFEFLAVAWRKPVIYHPVKMHPLYNHLHNSVARAIIWTRRGRR